MSLVRRGRELARAVALAAQFDDEVMVEQYISGREYTVGVLGDEALPVVEIRPKHELFDYECKYTPGMAEEIAPAPIDAALAAKLQDAAQRAHRALKLGGYSRIDFRADDDDGIFFLEANTLPGLTANSLIPKAARAAGMEFPVLCETICRLALRASGTKG
jgi:D-alanine-D-alanine ligase